MDRYLKKHLTVNFLIVFASADAYTFFLNEYLVD